MLGGLSLSLQSVRFIDACDPRDHTRQTRLLTKEAFLHYDCMIIHIDPAKRALSDKPDQWCDQGRTSHENEGKDAHRAKRRLPKHKYIRHALCMSQPMVVANVRWHSNEANHVSGVCHKALPDHSTPQITIHPPEFSDSQFCRRQWRNLQRKQ